MRCRAAPASLLRYVSGQRRPQTEPKSVESLLRWHAGTAHTGPAWFVDGVARTGERGTESAAEADKFAGHLAASGGSAQQRLQPCNALGAGGADGEVRWNFHIESSILA